MEEYELDRLLAQVRRIEEHREKGAEKEIRKTYQALLKNLRHYLADEYSRYAEDDQLTYEILQRHGAYARFLEEVEQKINDISPEVRRTIRSTVEQTYEYTYNGMIDCVKRVVADATITTGLKACTPEVIKHAVENPISKLTLNDRLEKHRKEIVYDIKQNISVGLMNGDRYSTMANRIKQSVDGDYKKAIRITRTETHRVREAAKWESAMETDRVLQTGESGMRMSKIWRTKKDERVRPAKAKGKNKQYDHRKMEGVTVLVDEEFPLPSGARAQYPGGSGVAGEDINCRCRLSYALQKQLVGAKAEFVYKNEPVYYDETNDYSINLPGYSEQVNQGLSKAARDVAMKGSKDRCEHMHLIDLKTGEDVFYETNGDPGSVGSAFWKVARENPDKNFAFIHNHNIISSFSETDLETAVTTKNIPVIIAMQNNGVSYAVERTADIPNSYYPDFYFEKELEELNKASRAGKIAPYERAIEREKIIVDGLIRDFFKKGVIKRDGRK